jgi:hypothetical protein
VITLKSFCAFCLTSNVFTVRMVHENPTYETICTNHLGHPVFISSHRKNES